MVFSTAFEISKSAFPAIAFFVPEVKQGGQVAVGLEDDIPAAAAVAAVGSALTDEFFTVKGDAAITSVSRTDFYCGIIYKHFSRQLD